MDAGNSSTPLHFGDFIILRLSKPDEGWLSSEGLLDDECFVTPETEDFHNCIWEIHVQNQYSATREYKEALSQSLVAVDNKESSKKGYGKHVAVPKKNISPEYLSQLHRAALNEQRLNDKLMHLKLGKPINYGDPIQLRHVKSRKFLTISSNVLARDERENMKISVDIDGDSLSCMGFIPRYRYEREGQLLTSSSEVMVRVHERPGEYLHAAKHFSGNRTEVNCSLESSFWMLILYQRVVDVGSNSIMAGQLITLQDPDNLSCVTLDNQIPGVTQSANVVMSPQFQAAAADATIGTNLLWLVEKANIIGGGPIGINTDGVTFRDLNTGLYMKFDSSRLIAVQHRSAASVFEFHNSQNTNSLDVPYVEGESAVNISCDNFWIGNVGKAENDPKHGAICTGYADKSIAISLTVSASLFQKIGVNLHVGVQATMKLRKLIKVTEQYNLGLALIKELSQEVKNCNSVLESLCLFLSSPNNSAKDDSHGLLNDTEVIHVRQNMVREQGLIDVLLDLLCQTESNIYDKIKESIAKRDPNARASARRIIRKQSVNGANDANENVAISFTPENNAPAVKRRSSLTLFGTRDKGEKPDKASKPTPNRTNLVGAKKNQYNVNVPDSDSEESEEDDDDDEEDEDKAEPTSTKERHSTVSQMLAQKCLKVLLCVIVDNFTNQLYVADRFPVLLAAVREHRLAVLCVEEMLRENLTILQTKVRQREIDIFVGLLGQSDMSVTFLRLLQSTCSCPMGVDATQRMVANALFSMSADNLRSRTASEDLTLTPSLGNVESRKSKSVIIDSSGSSNQKLIMQIVVDRAKKTAVDWGDLSLYCPINPQNIVLGYEQLADGLPEIWLSWRMKGRNGDFSMNQLFGYKDKVPLSIICSSSRKSISNKPNTVFESISSKAFRRQATIYNKKVNQGKKINVHQNQTIMAISNHKAQVAEYFKTQLYVVADLCLDRNYVSIGMLEPLFEYDVLISIMKSEFIPSGFKAPVCRVLRCLYVDRDPQIASKFPRYIRTSTSLDVDKVDNDLEPINEIDSKMFKFALLQKLLSNYVHQALDLSFCDELSAESIELLLALVKFGFYEKVPQILDIMKPLLKVLDVHQSPSKLANKINTVVETETSPRPNQTSGNLFGFIKNVFSSNSRYKQITPDGDDDNALAVETLQVPRGSWFKVWVERSDSMYWMMCVFTVVILSVAMMVVQFFSDISLSSFYITTTVFFGCEYIFRCFVNSFTEKGLKEFLVDPFNLLDICLVALDIVMLALGADGSQASASRATRSLRIVRIIRVARLIRAARLLRRIAVASKVKKTWEIPARFQTIKKYEAKTIVNILKVLTMFYDRIQDNTLELGIKAFSQWCKATKAKQICDPVETFNKALATEERLSSELSVKFDLVLLDAVMYSDMSITHTALHLLMVHKSQKDLFFRVFEKIQIIYSPRIENICKQLTDNLRELKGLAEMFEIWSELDSEEDLKAASRVEEILTCIMGYLSKRNDDRTLGIRTLSLVDEEVQNLLRNLDAMTTFMALLESLYDGGREELKPRVIELMRACNNVICMFVKTSDVNQAVAFKYLPWFVELIDVGINCSRVVRTIVEGNKSLIKQCSRRYLGEFAHKIVSDGRKPEYLDLFVGMTELSEVMGSHVLVVETEISTYLTGREWKKHILLWCAAAESAEYKERRAAMLAIKKKNQQITTDDDLSPELHYHVKILILLANCNLGPKLHALYPVQDILSGIMDSATVFPVKKALGQLMIEVLKTSSDRVEKLDSFWLLLDQIALDFESLPAEMLNLSRNHDLRIQRGEWLEITSAMVTSFFQDFDLAHYLDNRPEKSSNKNQNDAQVTIERLHKGIQNLIDQHAQKIGGAITEELIFAASVLSNLLDPEGGNDMDIMENNDNKLRAARMQHQRTSVVFADVQQVYYRKQFKVFLRHIKDSTSTSRDEVINVFKNIPSVRDDVESDVRLEPLLNKLSSHFRSSIKKSPLSRSINEDSVETCVWFLKAMRNLFEDKMGLPFEKLGQVDIGTLKESEKVEELRVIFNENGITYLCLDLIAVGMDHSLYIEAMKLLVVMLLKSGGCEESQKTIHTYLFETDSILFFELLKDMIESLKAWSNKETESNNLSSAVVPVPDDIIVLNLLQGICEGSYMGNRDQIREQTGNSKVINIIDSLATFVGILSRSETFAQNDVTITVLKTVLRLVQGPCKGNQEQFILHTELLISLNRMIRSTRPALRGSSAVVMSHFELLKASLIDILRGIIEGQPKNSLSFDRVTTTIDLSVLQILVIPPDQEILESILGPQGITPAQAKFLVLMESMKKIPDVITEDVDNVDIASVEVHWNNQIQVVYFPVPQFVKDLSAESKNTLLESDQDFPSRELKLMDFVSQIKTLHRESTHQQFLKKYGLSDLWTFKYYLTRVMFINAIIMNCLIITYYGTSYHSDAYYGGEVHVIGAHRMLGGSAAAATTVVNDHLYAPHHMTVILDWLNIVQLAFAIVTVGIFCVVRVPVTFATEFEKHKTYLSSILFTAFDPLPIWYFAYLVFTVLGMEVHHFFLSALLLDWIILDSTTQDLLLAVQYPARQLAATLVIILIMLNIFAGIMFVLFRHDVVTVPVKDMWDALKLCISYGFRGEYGIDHEMEPTLGVRMVLDVSFYFIILSILRHIFFAIIVDTFGKLRELKFERESEAKNTCFICGVERHDYDRIVPLGTTLGFAHHRNVVHYPMNYMAFIMNIWNQSQSEDTSLEIYVRECLKKGDVGWFPSGVMQELDASSHGLVAEAHGHHSNNSGGHGNNKKKGGHAPISTADAHKDHIPIEDDDLLGTSFSHTVAVSRRGSNGITSRPRSAVERPRSAADKEKTHSSNSDALLEKMHLMQQQLVTISKNISTATETRSLDLLVPTEETSSSLDPTKHMAYQQNLQLANSETSRAAIAEAVSLVNNVMSKMMDKIDGMEKRLSKSHKYLRHRIRLNNVNAKPTGSPLKLLTQLSNQKEATTVSKSSNQVSSPHGSADHIIPVIVEPTSRKPLFGEENDIEVHVDKSKDSDSESSLSTRCTAVSDEKNNNSSTSRSPQKQPTATRPTSAGVVRSAVPQSPLKDRPLSANPKTSSTTPSRTFSGPPKSLINAFN